MHEQLESTNPIIVEASQKSGTKTAFAKPLRVLAALALGTAIVIPFYFAGRNPDPRVSGVVGMINTHDLIQHIAVMQDFDKVLRAGILYPRWLPDINNGYGIAWANFYPPVFFYLSSLFNAVLKDWGITLFVLSALGFAASGLAFYQLARTFYGAFASGVGALLYMLLPYHVINIYWQGALPQFMGFVFLPLIMYFAFKLGSQSRARYYAGLGFVYGMYMMTHLPVGYLMTYALAFYAVIWAVTERDWRIALRIAIGMAIGLALAAIYLLPAGLEGRYAAEHFSAIFPYHSSYITLLPLQGFGNLVNLSFTLQTLALVTAIVVLRAVQRPATKAGAFRSASSLAQTRLLVVMAVATTFMNTSFSIYVSKLIPKIDIVSFAWRWMAIASLFTALGVAAAVDCLRDSAVMSPKRVLAYRVAISIMIASNLWLTVHGVMLGALSNSTHKQPAVYVEAAYIPKGSTVPQSLPDTPPVVITPQTGVSEIIGWAPQHREVIVRVDQPSDVRLKTYNFPGWTARIDGQQVPLSSDTDGIQVVSVPTGRHKVETDFGDTPPRKIGAILFLIALATIACLTLVDYRRVRIRNSFAENAESLREEAGVKAPRGVKGLAAEKGTRVVVAALVLAVMVVSGSFFVTRRLASGNEPSSNPTAEASPSSAASGINGVGSEARLSVGNSKSIPVSVDEKAVDELMNTLGNNDRVEELVRLGRLFRVDNNTKVRILEYGSGKTKVRILEGDSLAIDGWVPERWIR